MCFDPPGFFASLDQAEEIRTLRAQLEEAVLSQNRNAANAVVACETLRQELEQMTTSWVESRERHLKAEAALAASRSALIALRDEMRQFPPDASWAVVQAWADILGQATSIDKELK